MLQQYKKILVAIDGSAEAELAFKKAVSVAKRNQSKLELVHVIDVRAFQNIASYDEILAEQASDLAKKTLEEYVQTAKEQGLADVSYVVEYGTPKIIIAKDLPEKENIDLIMLGATGLNAVERLLIGSVSEYIIRHASCDVLIVRTDLNNELPPKKKKDN